MRVFLVFDVSSRAGRLAAALCVRGPEIGRPGIFLTFFPPSRSSHTFHGREIYSQIKEREIERETEGQECALSVLRLERSIMTPRAGYGCLGTILFFRKYTRIRMFRSGAWLECT